jgi:hypothetical protein
MMGEAKHLECGVVSENGFVRLNDLTVCKIDVVKKFMFYNGVYLVSVHCGDNKFETKCDIATMEKITGIKHVP